MLPILATMSDSDRADLVVVGAGTIGGWASVFAARDGAGRVIVLEQGLAGQGASSRAARTDLVRGPRPRHGRGRAAAGRRRQHIGRPNRDRAGDPDRGSEPP